MDRLLRAKDMKAGLGNATRLYNRFGEKRKRDGASTTHTTRRCVKIMVIRVSDINGGHGGINGMDAGGRGVPTTGDLGR